MFNKVGSRVRANTLNLVARCAGRFGEFEIFIRGLTRSFTIMDVPRRAIKVLDVGRVDYIISTSFLPE
jgi:hypothetical protein